ncbi:hypothetical protein LPP2_g12 [Leptolyngbya phage LPP-2, strain SPI]|uniref:Uncharacterized protein n=1 Tax=Leptolyngbya phage LPP-2, strain SPI TaxID=2996053 RepID=A0AAE9TIA7_9CAUD|nr:hypothetical protein LPP2_g12 [Leptolyngbya phage LPP-2 st. SPI]
MSTTYPSVVKEVHEDVNPNVQARNFWDVGFDHQTQRLEVYFEGEMYYDHEAHEVVTKYIGTDKLTEYQLSGLNTWSYFNIK